MYVIYKSKIIFNIFTFEKSTFPGFNGNLEYLGLVQMINPLLAGIYSAWLDDLDR